MALLYNVPVDSLKLTLSAQIGTTSALAFLLAQFLSMPCLAALGMLFKESGSFLVTLAIAAYTIVLPIGIVIVAHSFFMLIV